MGTAKKTLPETHPEVYAQVVDRDKELASRLDPKSKKRLTFQCSDGHPLYQWDSRLDTRVGNKGCHICSNHKVIRGYNDLSTTHPEIHSQLVEKDRAIGETVSYGSGKYLTFWCVGTKGKKHPYFEYKSTVKNKTQGRGCPACKGWAVIPGFNDVKTTHPHIFDQVVPEQKAVAEEVTAGSGKIFDFICSNGHPDYSWSQIMSRRTRQKGCVKCVTINKGVNDISTKRPDIFNQVADQSRELARRQGVGSHEKLWFFCDDGHDRVEYISCISKKVQGRKCPECSKSTSSMIEDILFDSTSSQHPNCVQSKRLYIPWRNNISMEVDVLIDDGIAIEYDGSYWHRKPASRDRDTAKSLALLDAGYQVIRIRENPLPSLNIDHESYHEIFVKPVEYSREDQVSSLIEKVLEAIGSIKSKDD